MITNVTIKHGNSLWRGHNLVTNTGLSLLGKVLAGQQQSLALSVRISKENSPSEAENNSIAGFLASVDSLEVVGGKLLVKFSVGYFEGNTEPINKLKLIIGQELFAETLLPEPILKDEYLKLEGEWEIEPNAEGIKTIDWIVDNMDPRENVTTDDGYLILP